MEYDISEYEQRKSPTSRHTEVLIYCLNCGSEKWVRWDRVKKGLGKYCSRQCSGEHSSKKNRQHFGKENAGFYWYAYGNKWMAYWKEEDGTQIKRSKAKWLWEMDGGEVPEGYVVYYRDGDPYNCEIDNLELISNEELARRIHTGKEMSDETKQKLSDAHTGKTLSGEHRKKISSSLYARWNSGEFDEIHVGEHNYRWKGGVEKSYPKEYNDDLREFIKSRDNYQCIVCRNNIDLQVHHIDRNKYNNDYDNLVTLCQQCHIKVHATKSPKNVHPVIYVLRNVME